jgi:cell division protein FtsI (penicillin-binding protein 3)
MMNPANGEILALANIGDYDPNNYSDYDDFSRKNRCITDLYEPGSTIKAITLAALLDQELCKESELINVENGRFVFKGKVIVDAHPHKILSVRGILEQSSNVGMVKLIQRMDDETLFKYLRGFGFGTPTGIELPGEVKGKLNKPSDWSLVSKAFLSFGYELSVTPIQMITAFSALVNGGIIYQPQIVRKLISPLDDEDVEIKAREIRRIISQKTSDRIKDLLASVVTNGTGQKAQLDKIDVGGKTGTSKILVNGKYSPTKYNSSFIGFYPVENPQVVCLILVNSPQVGGYGGLVAAPIFKEITRRALTSLQESYQNDSKESLKDEGINLIKTKAIEEQTELHEQVEIVNAINRNTLSPDFMPDLRNYSLREALVVLTKLGVKHQIIGSGKIISQSIMPGYKIKKGMICRITCSQQSKKSVSN